MVGSSDNGDRGSYVEIRHCSRLLSCFSFSKIELSFLKLFQVQEDLVKHGLGLNKSQRTQHFNGYLL